MGICLDHITYRDEQNTSKQCPGQCCFYNLLQAFVALVMTPKQGCDVKGKLGDGAKRGVDHGTDCKVTLSGYTAETETGLLQVGSGCERWSYKFV